MLQGVKTHKSTVMLKRLSLFIAVVTLGVSCKKEGLRKEEEPLAGSWQSIIQLQTGNNWPAINADSIRAAGNFSYELHSNHTGTFRKAVLRGTIPTVDDLLSRWRPGIPIRSVYTNTLPGAPFTFKYETIAIYWEYRKNEKELLIVDGHRKKLETWRLSEIQDQQLITHPLLLRTVTPLPGTEIKRHARIVFIKK